MSIMMIAVLAIIAIVLVVIIGGIATGAIICGDLMSYSATGTEELSPTGGTAAGSALVVYNPGVTGAAKTEAREIAGDLKSRGYTVTLTGIRSAAAANTSGYDVVMVGGPIYFGMQTSYTATYLKALALKQDARLGVFGTTGSNDFVQSDLESVEKQVASLQSDRKATVRLIGDRDEKKAVRECKDLVSAVAG